MFSPGMFARVLSMNTGRTWATHTDKSLAALFYVRASEGVQQMDDGTYKLYDLRVEELLEECNQAHLEFDYWLRWSYVALATLWAFVVGIWVSWFFDWPLPIRNVIAGLTIIAVLVVWSLQIPRAAALSRAERAIAEADALIKWMDRQLEKEIDS